MRKVGLLVLFAALFIMSCEKDEETKDPVSEIGEPEVLTVAGNGSMALQDGIGLETSFSSPTSIATDAAGNLYISDYYNFAIRKISPDVVVSTVAGGTAGDDNNTAPFAGPSGVAVGKDGVIYVADNVNHKIKSIKQGVVETLAGSTQGSLDGSLLESKFSYPGTIAVDKNQNLFVGDVPYFVRKISTTGVVQTLAAKINPNLVAPNLHLPLGLTINAKGEIIVADYAKHQILKINKNDSVVVVAGTGAEGSLDGKCTDATFKNPQGVAVDKKGNIYVADRGNNKIRMISPAGLVTTIAGTGSSGHKNGKRAEATFSEPSGIVVGIDGNLYVADRGNHMIRKMIL